MIVLFQGMSGSRLGKQMQINIQRTWALQCGMLKLLNFFSDYADVRGSED
jgi:hypothetical protein